MAHKTRTAQVLDIVKVLAWVVIAVSLVKFAFFPAAQEEQTNDGMEPGGSFGQMTIPVGRADITNTVTLTGTIQADEPVNARATLDGIVVRTFANDGDKVSKGDALLQIRKEIPGETRQVTDEEGNVSVETAEPTYKFETVVAPGDGTLSTGVLVGQQFAIGDTVASVSPSTFSAIAPLSADQMYRHHQEWPGALRVYGRQARDPERQDAGPEKRGERQLLHVRVHRPEGTLRDPV